MLAIDGKVYEFQLLPLIFFGRQKPLAYVVNPKAASTAAHNFIFYVNHGYRYFDASRLWESRVATLRIGGTEFLPDVLDLFLELRPECFSIVRDPLPRFISAFLSKVFTSDDPSYHAFREALTSLCDLDLSPEADPAKSCLAFAQWVAAQQDQQYLDAHFRPQHFNLAIGSRFKVDTILRLEEQDELHAYFGKWIGEGKAQWFLSLGFNEQTRYKASDCMSDELKSLVRTVYAKDYELFYS
jgi:hypothetical protein